MQLTVALLVVQTVFKTITSKFKFNCVYWFYIS